jgi:hypothetical protein
MADRKENKRNNIYLISFGMAMFSFSLLLFGKATCVCLPIIILFLSALMGVYSLFPKPLNLLKIKVILAIVNTLAYSAWFWGFVFGWLDGSQFDLKPWNNISLWFGYFWLYVIILLLNNTFYDFKQKDKRLFWLPWFIPASMLYTVTKVLIQGDYAATGVLAFIMISSIVAAIGKFKHLGTLPDLVS